jgi:septal ring-binding cell division protein DamX
MFIKAIKLDVYQLLRSYRLKLISLSILLGGVMPIDNSFADDYSQGVEAFLKGDYALAQQFWVVASADGDAKSMFNLGLLNEQSKVANSSSEKAEKWYREAANNGYSAAGYHLAQRLLELGGSDDDAIAMIKTAAEQGYAPALRYFGETPSSTKARAEASVNPLKKSSDMVPAASVDSDQRKEFLLESWINNQKSNYWTIQLLAFTQETKVQDFIDRHGLQSKAAYFVEQKDGIVWYKLIYGSFDSKDKATFARQNLSSKLQEYGPWLRTIASVQAITKG